MAEKSVFPERLKIARELRKMSQAELAAKAGIQPSAISHFESDLRKPSFKSLQLLATALEVTTDFLLGQVDETDAQTKILEEQIVQNKNVPRYIQKGIPQLVIDNSYVASGEISKIISHVNDMGMGVTSYQQMFAEEAKVQDSKGNQSFADTLHVFYIICDFWLCSQDIKEPFRPMMKMGNSRSPIPEDFSEQQIFQLGMTIDFISDVHMIARISDIVWMRLKKIEFARKAISAYLQSSQEEKIHATERFRSLERAYRLAKLIKSEIALKECKQVLVKFQHDDVLYSRLKIELLSLAQDLEIFNSNEIADEAIRLATISFELDPHLTKELLQIAATEKRKLKDETAVHECYRKIAKSYLHFSQKMDALTSGSFIEEAIDAYKRSGDRDEIKKLNKLLTEKGKESLEQMKTLYSTKVDFSDAVEAAKKMVSGLNPIGALRELAGQFLVPDYEENKSAVETAVKDHPLTYIIGSASISREGRRYYKRPSFMSQDPVELQKALDTEISARMHTMLEAMVNFCLLPALQELHWTTADFGSLYNVLESRPFIPERRVPFFFAGIKLGLEGTFVEAAHLLVPQIENSLRHLLESRGAIVTKLTPKDNLHREMTINELFDNYGGKIGEIFESKDLEYFLKSFLCSAEGENFRNELAHGLLDNPRDHRFVLVWWLTIYLVFRLKYK